MPSDDTTTRPSLRAAILLFAPLLFIYASSFFQRAGIPGTIFSRLQETGLDAVQISLISSFYIWVYAVSQLFVGMLADKYGGVRLIRVGGLLLVIGSLLFPCANHPILFYFARALTGLGSGTVFLSLLAEAARCFERKNYPTALGIIYASAYTGGLFATLPFAWLCEHFPWRTVLVTIGLLTALAYVFFQAISLRNPPPPSREAPLSLRPLLKILRNPHSWHVTLSYVLIYANYFVLQSVFGMKFLQDFAGFSATAASSVIFVGTIVCVVGVLVCGPLCRLMGHRRKPLLICCPIASLTAALTLLAATAFHLPPFFFAAAYTLFAASSSCPALNILLLQELNSRDVIALAPSFNNTFTYLMVPVLTTIVGFCLKCFPRPEGAAGGYSPHAYMTAFACMALLAIGGLVAALHIPETKGEYKA